MFGFRFDQLICQAVTLNADLLPANSLAATTAVLRFAENADQLRKRHLEA